MDSINATVLCRVLNKMMHWNIRMQPSDHQVPFNYLVIQSPEDTSVGKSSIFPWRDRKDVSH